MITCALVGAELTRRDTPYLPLTPREIADGARAAVEAGASMVHLHVRDSQGRPTCKKEIFQEVIRRIRARCRAIIQVSTGGAIGDSEEDRLEPLESDPDMASLTTGSINFGKEVFLNPQPWIEKLSRRMKEKGIKPEIEVFDNAMLENALNMVSRGLLEEPLHIDLVLGVPGGMAANAQNLDFLLSKVPQGYSWSVAAIGRHEFPMAELALKRGGHVRVGLEDNIYLEKGRLAESNAQLVEKVAAMAQAAGRPLATVGEARMLLGLK